MGAACSKVAQTSSCVLEAHAHAGIGNGNVIVPAVGLLELLDILQLLVEGQEHLDQDLCRLQVYPPAGSGISILQ